MSLVLRRQSSGCRSLRIRSDANGRRKGRGFPARDPPFLASSTRSAQASTQKRQSDSAVRLRRRTRRRPGRLPERWTHSRPFRTCDCSILHSPELVFCLICSSSRRCDAIRAAGMEVGGFEPGDAPKCLVSPSVSPVSSFHKRLEKRISTLWPAQARRMSFMFLQVAWHQRPAVLTPPSRRCRKGVGRRTGRRLAERKGRLLIKQRLLLM